jgi:hypothetical protein
MKRKQDFKIGRLDGAAFIMGIIFFVFVAAFFKSITYFRKHRKSNDLDAIYRKRGSVATENFFSRIFNLKNRTKTEAIQLNQDLKPNIALEEINTFDMSPLSMDDINYEEKNEIFPKRISQLNILDKMKYFGEKLELFIEDKFTRLFFNSYISDLYSFFHHLFLKEKNLKIFRLEKKIIITVIF